MAEFILYKQGSLYPGIVDHDLDLLHKVTNLQASAGILIFPQNEEGRGAVFVDGRYTLAAKKSVNTSRFDIEDLNYDVVIDWVRDNLPKRSTLLIDPKYFSYKDLLFFKNKLSDYSWEHIELSACFSHQKQSRSLDLYQLGTNKIPPIMEWLKEQTLPAYLICNPCFASWVLGIRDLANEGTCSVLGYLLMQTNGEHVIYLDESYQSCEIPGITTKSMRDLSSDLEKITDNIGTNYSELAAHIYTQNMVDMPCSVDQTVRTQEELQNTRLAAKYDSIAFIKFLHWFHTTGEKISELDAVEKLENFRKESLKYICKSFETIAAADEHAAIVHYTPTRKSNKYIDNILLIDAGGQYKNGTTDITRTICRKKTTQYQKEIFTLVLKGHIALANSKFPTGTTGAQLDSMARYSLWQNSLDYQHGTGHGIGYLLNVHEGKQSISKGCNFPIKANTVMSNEPGYYEEGNFGVRLENMVQVTPTEHDNYLYMDTISLIPFDPKFICVNMLTETEKFWLTNYYRNIVEQLSEELDSTVVSWLVEHYTCFPK